MASTTAFIFVGGTDLYHGGIYPTHFIELTENSRPALILHSYQVKRPPLVVIPTVENMADDVFLMICVYIMKKLNPVKQLHTKNKTSLYDILEDQERFELYKQAKAIFETNYIYIVFNLLIGSTLLRQIDKIKEYPINCEVTVPLFKKVFDRYNAETSYYDFKTDYFK